MKVANRVIRRSGARVKRHAATNAAPTTNQKASAPGIPATIQT
jgi:hypothetical protein